MKKVIVSSIIGVIIVSMVNFSFAKIANSNEQVENTIVQEEVQTNGRTVDDLIQEVNPTEKTGEIVELKEKEKKSIDYYNKKYGSEAYGFTAYILSKIRIYSIPLCFIGIAISAIYQYVIGIRKLDVRDKGFGLMIAIITVFVICQVLPLVFAIVVKGWRG